MAMGGAAHDRLSVDDIDIIAEHLNESDLTPLKNACEFYSLVTSEMLQNIRTVRSLLRELNIHGLLDRYNLNLLLVETLKRSDILDLIFRNSSANADGDRVQDSSHQRSSMFEQGHDSGFATASYGSRTPAENDTVNSPERDLSQQFKRLFSKEMESHKKIIVDELKNELRRDIQTLEEKVATLEMEKQQQLNSIEGLQVDMKKLQEENVKLRRKNAELRRLPERQRGDEQRDKESLERQVKTLTEQVKIFRGKGKETAKKQEEIISSLQQENRSLKEEMQRLLQEKEEADERACAFNKDNDKYLQGYFQERDAREEVSQQLEQCQEDNDTLVDKLHDAQVEILTAEEEARVAVRNLQRMKTAKEYID